MKQLDFGGSKNQKKTKKWNEIGQILVSGALDDTKTIGKIGADIFAKSGLEKPWKKVTNQDFLQDVPRFFCGFSLKPGNSRTNDWEPRVGLVTDPTWPSVPSVPNLQPRPRAAWLIRNRNHQLRPVFYAGCINCKG